MISVYCLCFYLYVSSSIVDFWRSSHLMQWLICHPLARSEPILGKMYFDILQLTYLYETDLHCVWLCLILLDVLIISSLSCIHLYWLLVHIEFVVSCYMYKLHKQSVKLSLFGKWNCLAFWDDYFSYHKTGTGLVNNRMT